MDSIHLKENLTKDIPVSSGLPPPRQVLNQSTEYQVIEKAAQLLKRVEQHWKKSLFQNKLQFSPISDSLNSSESEHYIEKLAAIKFKDASFKKSIPLGEAVHHNAFSHGFKRETSLERNLLMSYDIVSNYFDLMGSKGPNVTNNPGSERSKEETYPKKCQRCLDKAQSDTQKKSVSALPKQQYVFKHNMYGRKSGIIRHSRGGFGMQISPRSNDSLPTSRTYASAYSSPRNRTNLTGGKARMSSSHPDLRNINTREYLGSQHHMSRCCNNFCGTERLNHKTKESFKKSEPGISDRYFEAIDTSNVSVVNVKSNNQEGATIPEVNPRKMSSAPDKMIIIQHLPQVDIRPELSKQTGPVISIDAKATEEEQKYSKNNNIGVFNYVHKNKSEHPHKELKSFSNYTGRYRRLSGNNGCTEEESFAAQLELRSVAENFIYRLRKNDNPSGLVLMSSLLHLMDEVNELIDSHLSNNDVISTPADPNLPPRMEMVSDLLSDELKTWGAQHPSHYHSLNNIIQHLILDIRFAKNGNFDLKEFKHIKLDQHFNSSSPKKSSILKTRKNTSNYDQIGRHRHISLKGESSIDRERYEITHRSTHSEEMSLSDRLLQENALKVQRLEKAYKINHKVRILQKKAEEDKLKGLEQMKNSNEDSRSSSISELTDGVDKNISDLKRLQTSNSTSSNSHPVIAIVSPSHSDSVEEEDEKSISERASEAEDKSVAQELQEAGISESILEEDDVASKQTEEPISQENLNDKQVSDAEEEVEEVLSESSQPALDKQADSNASDYDEDFEVDITENPSQSATVSTHKEKEKVGKKLSRSHTMGVDEVCQTDDIESLKLGSSKIKQGKKESIINKNDVQVPYDFIPSDDREEDVNKRYDNNRLHERNIDETPREEENSTKSIASQQTHLWHNSKKKMLHKNVHETINEFDENQNVQQVFKRTIGDKENNFVKVHVRDELGEIILSYAGSKQNAENKSATSNLEENDKKINSDCSSKTETKLLPSKNVNDFIETERNNLENLTSTVLKELLGDKIQEILSKYTFNNAEKNSIQDRDQPSTSKLSLNKEQYTQTVNEKNESRSTSTYEPQYDMSQDKERTDNDYLLKSPLVKLNTEKPSRVDAVIDIPLNDNENVEENKIEKELSIQYESNENEDTIICSPDLKLLISLVEDLDSSDIEYCEASFKQLSDDGTKEKPEVKNGNLRLHHFNSDEFLVYPRLNPQPSDIKTLQYTENEMRHDISEDSRKLEVESFRNVETIKPPQISFRSIGTECDSNEFKRLHPLPENFQNLVKTNFSCSSTQTNNTRPVVNPFTQTSSINLVDLIEISCSQSSSSSADLHKEKLDNVDREISEASVVNVSSVKSLSNELNKKSLQQESLHMNSNIKPQVDFPINEQFLTKSEQSGLSSVTHSESNSPNLITRLRTRVGLGGGNEELLEQNDEISSSSNGTECSSPSETHHSQSRLTDTMMRVLEVSSSRPAAWSSSTESTTDDEKIFILNQPISDDDALGDLEQLMDYLKSSKSSTSNVRIRQCFRHKKTV